MNELALFAGAGGGLLASKLLGWSTVGAIEIEKYPRDVLLQRQRDGMLDPFPIWDDVRTFDGKPWRGLVDVVSGGFPCQDISAAGKGAGLAGSRSGLWFEYLRIVGEVRPRFVFAENSPNLRTRGLGTIIEGLTSLGYGVRWGVLGAWHIGAPHKRDRMWVLAHAPSERLHHQANIEKLEIAGQGELLPIQSRNTKDVAYSNRHTAAKRRQHAACTPEGPSGRDRVGRGEGDGGQGCPRESRETTGSLAHTDNTGCQEQRIFFTDAAEYKTSECGGWWRIEPRLGGTFNGMAARLDATGLAHAETTRAGQKLRAVWGEVASQTLWEEVGRLGGIQAEAVLLAFLRKHPPGTWQPRTILESTETLRRELRALRQDTDARGTPLQRKPGGQPKAEHTDALRFMSRLVASRGQTPWDSPCWEVSVPRVKPKVPDRVGRLKAIGNGQVPAVAATAFRLLSHDLV